MVRALAPAAIVKAWEWGVARPPVDRALVILWAGSPDEDAEALLRMPIGARDHRLLALRRATFGDELPCVMSCPACGETLEFALSAHALLDQTAPDSEPPKAVVRDGYGVRLRSLDSRDLAAAACCTDVEAAVATLIERAVVSATYDDGAVSVEALPTAVRDAVAEGLAMVDAAADISLDLSCPACGHSWQEPFDIAAYVWAEIESEAGRLLRDVAALARAYGWRESDILAMSPMRRRAYLELGGTG